MSRQAMDVANGELADIAHYAIVVATRDRGAKIVPLIESVQANDTQTFEMIVVDQSLTDETERAIEPFLIDRRIRYVRSSSVGLSRARNLGISLTSAPIIAITDDDCIVPRNWLTGIGQPFVDHPRVGVVFCSVEPIPVDAPGYTPHIIFSRNRILRNPKAAWTSAGDGLSLGAGMAIRRSTFLQLQGFDELLGAGARFGSTEDNDLSWRGMLQGWATFQCADVSVVHDGFRTLDEVRSLVVRDLYGVGGAVAKYLRTGRWQISWFLASWLIRFGVTLPACDLLAGRRPRGLRRPYFLVRGVIDGLRTPLDHSDLLYQRNSSLATD